MLCVHVCVGAGEGLEGEEETTHTLERRRLIHTVSIIHTLRFMHTFLVQDTSLPVHIGYAMVINKAQGWTPFVTGMYLEESCLSHGQLRVGCSRVRSTLFILIKIPTACQYHL